METYKDLCNSKPSIALRQMVKGLLKQTQRPNFHINMMSYGSTADEICFGCAATCAVQELKGLDLDSVTIQTLELRAGALNTSCLDQKEFEQAIDAARVGRILELFEYMGVPDRYNSSYDRRFCLCTRNWRDELEPVEHLIRELEAAGL
ncbi:hypothetical protein ACQ4M3_07880 [Leptolyngbya sp. AN03gr2]|uniref:hypothetical protein n=1 Tax=unclassified Leptolyngbya TaxID=2650499 RepID=UPI003D3172B7